MDRIIKNRWLVLISASLKYRKSWGVILLFSATLLFLLLPGECVIKDNIQTSSEVYVQVVNSHVLKDTAIPLKINDQKLQFDEKTGTYLFSVTTKELESVEIELYGKTKSGAVFEKPITEDSIAQNETVNLLVYDDKYYYKFPIRCTTLPILSINTNGLQIEDDNVQASISLFDNKKEVEDRIIESKCQIRLRGATAKGYAKKGYRISLKENSGNGNRHENLLGLRNDDDWILYAAYNDPEKVRNVFSSNLWTDISGNRNSFGIENGMRYEYLEVFINGSYEGLYALGYPIDDKQLGIAKSDEGCSFKVIAWEDMKTLQAEEDSVLHGGIELSSSGKDRWDLLKNYYALCSDKEAENEVLKKAIDLDNAIDFMLFVNLIQGTDNVFDKNSKNMYLTFPEKAGMEGKVLYTPWDLDLTWGNQFGANLPNSTILYGTKVSANSIWQNGALYELLMRKDEEIWAQYLDRYWELRSDAWSEASLMKRIEDCEQDIFSSGAFFRDKERWPDGAYAQNGMEQFKAYVRERLKECDLYYQNLSMVKDQSVFEFKLCQINHLEQCRFLLSLADKEAAKEILEYLELSIPENELHKGMFLLYAPETESYEIVQEWGSLGDCYQNVLGEISIIENDNPGKLNYMLDGDKLFSFYPEKPEELTLTAIGKRIGEYLIVIE